MLPYGVRTGLLRVRSGIERAARRTLYGSRPTWKRPPTPDTRRLGLAHPRLPLRERGGTSHLLEPAATRPCEPHLRPARAADRRHQLHDRQPAAAAPGHGGVPHLPAQLSHGRLDRVRGHRPREWPTRVLPGLASGSVLPRLHRLPADEPPDGRRPDDARLPGLRRRHRPPVRAARVLGAKGPGALLARDA